MFDFNQSMENHNLYFLQYLRLLPDPNFSFIQDLVTNENYHHPDCDAESLIVNVFLVIQKSFRITNIKIFIEIGIFKRNGKNSKQSTKMT